MDTIYPAGPDAVPADLTRPTASYRLHAWLAMGGLALFVVLYVSLAGWFAWTAYHLLFRVGMTGAGGFWTLVAGGCSAFLAVFMLKALFFVKHGGESEDIEITAQEQPRLFAFLHRLADEAGAPRPHRVYLSNRVNASVFYDLSVANLFFPSRKNLEIGLALVNVLSLSELKAVLAHEFGHFAQRTMYVGRWVYIGQQIAAHIIAKRDILDRFLQALSRFDLRVAWIGWVLSIVVWSIRSVTELVFRLVILAQHALSREMEFQADLVAVSLTGSDALIHALHRLNAADDAWSRAVNFAASELRNGRRVRDLFAIQTRVIEQLARVLAQPDLGQVPPLPEQQRETHRVFKAQLAQPPRMWLTHPPSAEREENCKRRYIPAPLDERSAWELFDNVPALKERLSEHLFKTKEPVDAVPIEESLKRLDEQFDRAYLNRAYRGAYLGRSIVRHADSVQDLYGEAPPTDRILATLDALYPESLGEDVERLRELEEEQATLKALQDGSLTAPNGIIRYRGKELKRSQLAEAIAEVGLEIETVRGRVLDHDRMCRTVHLAAANSFGAGWGEYLQGLLHVLHYAEHTEANLVDADGYFGNVYSMAMADKKVSQRELEELITAADVVHSALREINEHRESVTLDRTLLHRMGVESWADCVEPLRLPEPTSQNIGDWLRVFSSWVNAYVGALSALRLAALEQLLLAESQVANFVRTGLTPAEAPPASQVPRKYTIRKPGMERPRQTKLHWWDRFQTADGTLATIARLTVAAVIVGAVVFVGTTVGQHVVAVYNGLDREVVVTVGEKQARLAPFSSDSVYVPDATSYHVEARTAEGEIIESFDAPLHAGVSTHVYNVASAAPLTEWTVRYGDSGPINHDARALGVPRWSGSNADHIFEGPPPRASSRGTRIRRVVQAPGSIFPYKMVNAIESEKLQHRLIATHARWERSDSRHLGYWFMAAAKDRDLLRDIVTARLDAYPHDVVALLMEQNLAARMQGDLPGVCERHRALAGKHPENGGLQFLAARCIDNGDERNAAYLGLAQKFPQNGWANLAGGYAHITREEWDDVLREFRLAYENAPEASAFFTQHWVRVHRVTQTDTPIVLEKLATELPRLNDVLNLESGYRVQGPWIAYHHLSQGELEAALKAAEPDPQLHARILRLAAASDGASRTLVRRALALSLDEGIDELTVWYALALAAREGASTRPYVDAIRRTLPDDATELLAMFNALRAGATPKQVLEGNSDLEVRGFAYAIGVILRGQSAPAEWRWNASKLLFAHERPFFTRVTRPQPENPNVKRTPPRFLSGP